jgi:iron complex outermembrane receptor protein
MAVAIVHAADTANAPEVVVTSEAESLTVPSLGKAAEQNKEVPGGFTLQSTDEMEHGRASNFEDLLQRVPGVFLQTENGAEATKISIRGSGILSEDEPLGVQFLLDGLTLNQGDGEAILEDFDLATMNYAEIFRGADAFRYGSITLGGAINLVTKTGREADPFQVEVEGGSFGYFRGETTSGWSDGPADLIFSLMGRVRDGFREHSAENTERLFGDIGYRLNDQWESRFYVNLDHVERQLPGGLTKSQLNDDPEQASRDAVEEDFNKKWDFIRLADKISFRSESIDFDAGLFWFHRNLEERGFFSEDFRQGIEAFYSDNYGLTANIVSRDELFGQRNTLTAGFDFQVERERSQNFENLNGVRGRTTALSTAISINAPFYAEDHLYLTDKLSALAGIQLIYAQRHFEDRFLTDAEGDQSHEQNFFGWNPKVGVIYELDPKSELFMNYSGSWQPPSFDNMVEFADGANSSVVYTPLQPQRAWTVELGTRGEHGPFEWDLSIYHAWVHDELLELNDAHGNDIGAVNVRRSFHQGIETSLDIDLLNLVIQFDQKVQTHDRLTLGQTYTLNDFHFDNDPVYGDNRLAGLPIHIYEIELLYESTTGFYAGPNVQCNLSRYPVDQANRLYADPYALLGFKIGYQKRKGIAVFVEAKNLTDKRFASAVDPIADSRTAPGAQIFHPGDGRAFYGGISWSW